MSSDADSLNPKSINAPGTPTASVPFGPLSELEAALSGEPSKARDAAAVASAQLDKMVQRTQQALAAGAPAVEFAQLSAVLKACHTAKEILDRAVTRGGSNARM